MKRRQSKDSESSTERNVKSKIDKKNKDSWKFQIVERYWQKNVYVHQSTVQVYRMYEGDLEGFKHLIRNQVIVRVNKPLETDHRDENWRIWRAPDPNLHLFELGPNSSSLFPLSDKALDVCSAINDVKRNLPLALGKNAGTFRRDPILGLPIYMGGFFHEDPIWIRGWRLAGFPIDKTYVHVPPHRLKQWTRDCIDAFRMDLTTYLKEQLPVSNLFSAPLWKLVADYIWQDFIIECAEEQLNLLKNYLPFMRFGADYAAWTNNYTAAAAISRQLGAIERKTKPITSTALTIACQMGHVEFIRLYECFPTLETANGEDTWCWLRPKPLCGDQNHVEEKRVELQSMTQEQRQQFARDTYCRLCVYFTHMESEMGMSPELTKALGACEDYLY